MIRAAQDFKLFFQKYFVENGISEQIKRVYKTAWKKTLQTFIYPPWLNIIEKSCGRFLW